MNTTTKKDKMKHECDICNEAEATIKYKIGLRIQFYYCGDCDPKWCYENEQANYEQQVLEEA